MQQNSPHWPLPSRWPLTPGRAMRWGSQETSLSPLAFPVTKALTQNERSLTRREIRSFREGFQEPLDRDGPCQLALHPFLRRDAEPFPERRIAQKRKQAVVDLVLIGAVADQA